MTVSLTPVQSEIFTHPARFRVAVAGRRSGKTTLMVVDSSLAALQIPRAVVWYVAPTYRMAKEISWDMYKRFIPRYYLKHAPNESELSFRFVNDSRLVLKGADNPDSLRGAGLDYLAADEFAMIDPKAWTEVLRPALADKQGRALFGTTPKGLNWAYDLFLQGIERSAQWASWQITTAQGGIVSEEELAAARASMDLRTYRQEFEASFESLSGRVYDAFDRNEHVKQSVMDTGAELYIGMDFNINPMTAVVAVKAGDQCHVIDAIELMTSHTQEMADVLKSRYPGRRIIVYPDPSARSRHTNAPGSQTDFTILQNAGFVVDAPAKAPLVKDRVNATNALFKDANGRVRCIIHPRAAKLVRALDGLVYREDTNVPDKSSGLDHITDALGYMIWQRFNLLQQGWRPVRVRY